MSTTNNMIAVFEKLNDLKALFKFGEKIVPIIQSLVEFMKEIIPLLETINSSISDSTKKMPLASTQINDVTSATEMATTQILDLVDDIGIAVSNVETAILEEAERKSSLLATFSRIEKALEGNATVSAEMAALREFLENQQLKETYVGLLDAIKDDTYKITLALQVQDITAQQLAAVNHLIESVNVRLTELVADIEESEIRSEFMPGDITGNVHFDPNASFTNTEGKQETADALVRESKQQQ